MFVPVVLQNRNGVCIMRQLEKALPAILEHCFGSPYPVRTVLRYTDARLRLCERSIEGDTIQEALANAQAWLAQAEADGTAWKRKREKIRVTYANSPEISMELATQNVMLANKVAVKFFGRGARAEHMARIGTLHDFCAQAFLFLIRAARTFQPQLGYQFSTHVYPSVRLMLETWVGHEIKKCALGMPIYKGGVYNDGSGKHPEKVIGFEAVSNTFEKYHPACKTDHIQEIDNQDHTQFVLNRITLAARRIKGRPGETIRQAIKHREIKPVTIMGAMGLTQQTKGQRQTFSRHLGDGMGQLRAIVMMDKIEF